MKNLTLKKGDFITINYTGKLTDGTLFDTTDEKIGKEAGMEGNFHPVTICLGEGHLLKGLDNALIGKDIGEHTIELPAQKAFGKKSTQLLQLVPMSQLKKQGINAQPGMELHIDNRYGVVKSVSGGRVVVDFNHPLSGHDVVYDIEVIKIVTNLQEQIEALMKVVGLPYENIKAEGKHVILKAKDLYPQQVMDALSKKITDLTDASDVSFESGEKKV